MVVGVMQCLFLAIRPANTIKVQQRYLVRPLRKDAIDAIDARRAQYHPPKKDDARLEQSVTPCHSPSGSPTRLM